MAADESYYPLVYMQQGSTELVIASSGLVTVEDGGKVTAESGGYMELQSGGYLEIEGGGYVTIAADGYITLASDAYITVGSGGEIRHYVSGATSSASGSTTLSTLTNDGFSWITSSGDARKLYLTAPYAGALKFIHFTAGTTGTYIYIDAEGVSTGTYFNVGGNSTHRYLIREGTTSSAAAADLILVGHSTSLWHVAYKTTGWTAADTSS